MLAIRLMPGGTRHHPHFGIVVMETNSKRNGRFIEKIGWYSPTCKLDELKSVIKLDRVSYWMKCGAQPTKTVHTIINFAKRNMNKSIGQKTQEAISAKENHIASPQELIKQLFSLKLINQNEADLYLNNYKFFEQNRLTIQNDYSSNWVACVNNEIIFEKSLSLLKKQLSCLQNWERAYIEYVKGD